MDSVAREMLLIEAKELFDVAGITNSGLDSWLVLGMSSSNERDLDEFIRQNDGEINFVAGFDRYIRPGLEKLVEIAAQSGIKAEIYGNCGYPRGNDFNIKQNVVAAGLAQWGRNSMVLHPEYGLSLRFVVIKIPDTQLPPTGVGQVNYDISPYCSNCQACQQACPVNVIDDGKVIDSEACLANFNHMTGDHKLTWCSICIDTCPIGKK
jgi:epoxyqueuosine reductase QueG